MYSKNPSDPQSRLVPLAEDLEYCAAQAAVAAAEKTMLGAERRFKAALTPTAEWVARRDVEKARVALATANEKVAEIKSARSLEVCTALRQKQHAHLRSLLTALEAA